MVLQVLQQWLETLAIEGMTFIRPASSLLRQKGTREQYKKQMQLIFDDQLKSRAFLIHFIHDGVQ
ncbi:hypothetical protein D3C71_2221830 [compost metagenome]